MSDFFNHRYANEVRKAVLEIDPDAAELFTVMVVHDVLYKHIDENRSLVSKRVEEVLNSIRSDVSKSLVKRELNGDAAAVATVVGLVSKSNWWEREWRNGDPDWVTRDDKGRFARRTVKITEKDGQRRLVVRETRGRGRSREYRDFDVPQAFAQTSRGASEFAERWTRETDPRNPSERTYNRIAAGSKILATAGQATGNTPMWAAGELGRFAGSFGPEAEKVVGPSIRRAAYRYRGTERPVDTDLNRTRMRLAQEYRKQRNLDPATPLTPEVKQEISRQAAIDYVLRNNKLPKADLAELQRKSGKLPPSEGFLINADGKIITQAVGYMEDHYLPFNLRNLKGLQGGSYVRTRSSGGLTSEDIYTGLMAGARSVTVVSRSGVFTLDFEEDFRGSRRYSDKARQMVDRYERTLDAVQSKQVTRKPLTTEEKIMIREQTEEELSYLADDYEGRKVIEETIKQRLKEYNRDTHITPEEFRKIDADAREMAKLRSTRPNQTEEQRYREIRAQMLENLAEEKEKRFYQLDGEGYEVALNALQEQFPYYIQGVRVKNRKPDTNTLLSREEDTGYVRPRYNRPKAVMAGYYDSDIEGRGKYSAAETNFQNYRSRKAEQAQTATQPEQTNQQGQAKQAAPAANKPLNAKEIREQATRAVEAEDALYEAITWHAQNIDDPVMAKIERAIIGKDKAERNAILRNELRNPETREGVMTILNNAEKILEQHPDLLEKSQRYLRTYQTLSQYAERGKLDPQNWDGVSPIAPAKFDDVPEGRPKEFYQDLWKRKAGQVIPTSATDTDLREISQNFWAAADLLEQAASGNKPEGREALAVIGRLRLPESHQKRVTDMLMQGVPEGQEENAKQLAASLRGFAVNAEKMRTIKMHMGETETPKETENSSPARLTAQRKLSDTELQDSLAQYEESIQSAPESDLKAIRALNQAIASKSAQDVYRALYQIKEPTIHGAVRNLLKRSEYGDGLRD